MQAEQAWLAADLKMCRQGLESPQPARVQSAISYDKFLRVKQMNYERAILRADDLRRMLSEREDALKERQTMKQDAIERQRALNMQR